VSLSQQRGTASLAANHISGLAPWRYLWVYVLPDTAAAAVNVYWQSSPVGPADGQLSPGQYRLFDTGSTSARDVWFAPSVAGQAIDIQWITDTDPISEQVSTPGPMQVEGAVSITGNPAVTVNGTATVAISGTPTVNLAGGTAVAISGTPTVNLAAGAAVTISGTPTVNFAAGSSVSISAGNVALNGGQSGVLIETTGLALDLADAQPLAYFQLSPTSANATYSYTPGNGISELVVVAVNTHSTTAMTVSLGGLDFAKLPAESAAGAPARATLFATGIESGTSPVPITLAWTPAQPGSGSSPYAMVYRLRPAYLSASIDLGLVNGGTSELIAATAGKSIIVYDWQMTIGAGTAAAGHYAILGADDSGAVDVFRVDTYLATAVGESVVPGSGAWPAGLALPLGKGLELTALTPSSSDYVNVAGVVHYSLF
jgi:hypothetical protein